MALGSCFQLFYPCILLILPDFVQYLRQTRMRSFVVKYINEIYR
jgi:hypothetical protein